MRKLLLGAAALSFGLGAVPLSFGLGAAQAQTLAPALSDPAADPAAAPPVASPARPMPRAVGRRQPVQPGLAAARPVTGNEEYRGGAGSPYSTTATNINGGQHGEMGSRLPSPDAASDTPEALLGAAQRALNANQTGAAQQALEMAQTRVLSRTVDPAEANRPDTARMTQEITAARQALGRKDIAGAKAAVQAAMAAPVPPPGPATTGGGPLYR